MSRPANLSALIEDVLDDDARRVSVSAAEIESGVARLQDGFARIRATMAARQRIQTALAHLPDDRCQGWMAGARAAFKVVIGDASRSVRILVDAARDLLPPAPDPWAFAGAAMPTTRGATTTARADSYEASEMVRSLIVEDAADGPRVLGIIRNFPADEAPPVLLIIDENDPAATAIEIDAEVIADPVAGRVRLRYEAALPSKACYLWLGNSRKVSP